MSDEYETWHRAGSIGDLVTPPSKLEHKISNRASTATVTDYDVFVSYSSADREIAAQIVAMLRTFNLKIFWDGDIAQGARFSQIINQALSSAKAVVVILSPTAVLSRFVIAEASYARAKRKLIAMGVPGTEIPAASIGIKLINIIPTSDRAGLIRALSSLDVQATSENHSEYSATEVDRTSDSFFLRVPVKVYRNLDVIELLEHAIRRGEGQFASTGALAVETGAHTGRSAQDKFTVRDATTEQTLWWDNNKAMTPAQFDTLEQDFLAHAASRELFVQDLYAGADEAYRLNTRVFCEFAWHALFIRHLLRRPAASELAAFAPEFTVVNLPSFKADPARHGCRSETVIACNFTKRLVLIGGSAYAGETKKSVFSFLNFLMPERGVMPMHCSANVGPAGDSAVFFGLSGTGKTTLSADPSRTLLGDDEHGWSPNGIYNFEGGCYAKTIRLSKQAEPEIWAASNRFGTVLENVVLREDRSPDFDNGKLTENTRSAYPLSFIANASATGTAGHPKNIVMLCADAFGVLPPIAKLSASQAMYHFLSGYTAKVAGTEKGMGNEPQATFSTCFGAPFMPRHPSVYGNMLRGLIGEHGIDCWLVNTGWTGGKYGTGHRMPIKATRALLSAALSGKLAKQAMRVDPLFGFEVPLALDGVDAKILDPRQTWADKAAYDTQAKALVEMFARNFAKFEDRVDAEVVVAAPAASNAA